MSSNNAAGTPSATKKPAPRLKWDNLDGIRTVLYVLYTRYNYLNATRYGEIIGHMFKEQLEAMGFTNGIVNGDRIGAEWRSRTKVEAKDKWADVLGRTWAVTDKVAMDRDRWESLVRIAAGRIGIEMKEEMDSESDGEGEGGGAQGGEEDRPAVTAEEYREDAAAFRKKHTKQDSE